MPTIDSAVNLLEALAQQRLLEPAQLEEARSLRGRFSDSRAFAKELVQRSWLTSFQASQVLANRAGDLILGGYIILDRLGQGGMGTVYKARNRKLGRVVAIKVIRKERLSNPTALKRFRREIEVASSLVHPNVVMAYDADQIGDTHVFAMEYVEGIDLARLVKEKGPLPVARACDYIRQAALGLQHAHEKGLVHRDIKPNNLLVTKDSRGNHLVKILDMGLARVIETEDTTLTKEGSIMGTPDFIAPEQARDAHKADIRADLYSLGCAFFYVLAGQVPFQGGSLTEKLLKHYIEPPPPIQKVRPEVPPGVAAILHKLLEKKPADRYQTPLELADALGEIITPDGKFTAKAKQGGLVVPTGLKKKKNRTQREGRSGSKRFLLVGGLLLVLALAVTAGLTMLGSGVPASTTVSTPTAAGKTTTSVATTVATPSTKRIETLAGLAGLDRRAIPAEERMPFLPAEAVAVMGEHHGRHYGGPVPGLAFSPDGTLVASAGPDGVRIWRATDLRQQAQLKVSSAYALAFSSDGGLLAVSDLSGTVRIYDFSRLGSEPLLLKAEAGAQGPAYAIAFAPQGRVLAIARSTSDEGAITLWDLGGPQPQRLASMRSHRGAIYGVAFAPNGQLLATGGQDGQVRLWDLNGQQRGICNHSRTVRSLAFGSQVLASGGDDGIIRFWDAATTKPFRVPQVAAGAMVLSLAMTRQQLVAGLFNGQIQLYNWQTGTSLATLNDLNTVTAVAVDSQRRMIASATLNGSVRIWDWGDEIRERPTAKGHLGSILSLAFTPDGSTLASGSGDGSVKLWEMAGAAPRERDLRPSLGGMCMIALAPDGGQLAALGQLAQLRLWDLPGGSVFRELQKGAKNRLVSPGGVAFSPDGRLLAATDADPRLIRLWDMTKNQARDLNTLAGHEGQISAVAFADGNTLASASNVDGTVRVWNVSTRQVIQQYDTSKGQPLVSLAFSPDGRLLAFGNSDGIVRLCDIRQGGPPRDLSAHQGMAWSTAFAPTGDTLATGGSDGQLILWHSATGQKIREWQLGGDILVLRFAADGRHLAVGNGNGTIYILRLG